MREQITPRRRTRQKQFEDACERLENALERSETPRFSLYRVAIGTVFLMQNFDPERAQNLLKDVYRLYQDVESRQRQNEAGYIQRKDTEPETPEKS